ncbi:hypothetical protein VSH64_08325 [Amycolatopsis rhabdoformis]|uniref:Uncharacterized protein n=1 Tax=Amycolatopsis rhabdoformis TaxID=1448059 RepID=A0ABZ1ICH1_9PSEU|nr:hypothetical protein [Amycolatopsis rhabdoformis]WSE32112.1 hypothetical protein VSH64_08325 [Amycolatopsis rhabdoformis]
MIFFVRFGLDRDSRIEGVPSSRFERDEFFVDEHFADQVRGQPVTRRFAGLS